MIDFFFQMGLSNACFSLALGIVAMVVGAKARRPALAHLLWLLVFVKLLTPPIMTIPVVTIPAPAETAVAINENSQPGLPLSNNPQLNIETSPWSTHGYTAWNHARVWLPPIWLLGSVVVFAFSIVRVCRFSRLLAAKSEAARQDLQTAAVEIAHRLGLNRIPTILTTSANLSPMVWWAGGKVRIVIPKALLYKMDPQQWKWIIAHELAHVRRHDYLVRWLEWLACVCFWWNPVVWWAQCNLRATEEICCDELVISCLNPKPKTYANSLLSAVEFLARPVFRPPAMASEINSGGFLERRFKMIVSDNPKKSNARWLQVCVLLCAAVVLPVGIASAQDYAAVERRLGEGVAKGELTLKQASTMMDALRKAGAKKDQGADGAQAYLMKVKKELSELVETDKISKEDAARKYEDVQKGIKERIARQSERGQRSITVEEYRRAEAKMRKMIADGKAKPKDVERRLIEMRKMIGGQSKRGGDKQSEYEGFERRIKAAVREGKMTREEAGEKLAGFRRRMEMVEQGEQRERRITREDYARAEAELKKAIAEGRISEEDARTRLNGMRRMIAGQSERGDRERPDWEGIKRRIEAAVKNGNMTREEANAKYKEIRQRMAAGREQ